MVTSFSWNRTLTVPVFGMRLAVERCSRAAAFSGTDIGMRCSCYYALRRRLAELDDCVVYAQGPLAAKAALRARRGLHQRVILAVHFRISTSDEWAVKKRIKRGGTVFRRIRQAEREIIPQVDGIVYVSRWARDALLGWLPEAAAVPADGHLQLRGSADSAPSMPEPSGILSRLEISTLVKNHRYLFDVLAETKKAGQVFTLDVFGEGPLRNDLVRQISSLGLDDQVRLRGFRSEVRTLLPGYRAYVHASYSESSSLAIIEAMAAGLPIVAGNFGPISELFDDGVEGRYWPLDDPVRAAADIDRSSRLRAGAPEGRELRHRTIPS